VARGTVRFWAAAKEAAGRAEEPYDAATLHEALVAVRSAHSERFATVLATCSLIVDGSPVGARDPARVPLTDGGVVEVLPAFAGG
jgi:molybdopterin converting factor small subunit